MYFPTEKNPNTTIADKHICLCVYVRVCMCVCVKDQGVSDGKYRMECVSRFIHAIGLVDNNYCFVALSESYVAICI